MGHKEKKSIEWHITPITFHIDGNIRKNEIPTKGQTSWGRRLLTTMIHDSEGSDESIQSSRGYEPRVYVLSEKVESRPKITPTTDFY